MTNELLYMQEGITYALDVKLPTLREKYKKAIEFIKCIAKETHERSCPNYCNKCNAENLLRELGEIE